MMDYCDFFVGFSKSRHRFPVVGKLIEFFQKGISHSFVAIYLNNEWYAIDATSSGVKVHTLTKFKNHHEIVRSYYLKSSEHQRLVVLNWAIHRSYQTYPALEIMGNLIQILVKGITFGKIQIKNPLGQGKHYPRCNELVAMILDEILGYPGGLDLDDTDLIWLESFVANISKAHQDEGGEDGESHPA